MSPLHRSWLADEADAIKYQREMREHMLVIVHHEMPDVRLVVRRAEGIRPARPPLATG